MDYLNPASMMPSPQTFDTTSPLQAMQAQTQMNIATPFLQMAQQGQGLDLQKKAQEVSEFMSPEGQAARLATLGKTRAEAEAATKVAPERALADIADAKRKVATSASLTDKDIAEAKDAAMKAQGAPVAQFYKDMADFNSALENAPEQIRPILYQHGIQQWQAQNPGAKLPPQFATYDPKLMGSIAYAHLHSVEQQQKIAALEVPAIAELRKAEIERQSREKIAQGAQQTQLEIAREHTKALTSGAKMNTQQQLSLMRERLRQNPNDEEARLSAEGILGTMHDALRQQDQNQNFADMLAINKAPAGPAREKVLQNIQARKAMNRQQYIQNNLQEVYGRRTPATPGATTGGISAGRVIVRDSKGKQYSLPANQLDAAKQQGYIEVK